MRVEEAVRLAERLAVLCAGTMALVVAATDCSGPAVPQAFVSSAQQAVISRFYVRKLWLGGPGHSVGCPVDVLGAQRIHGRLRVYTVVVCKSFTARCAEQTAYTEGLVADMAGYPGRGRSSRRCPGRGRRRCRGLDLSGVASLHSARLYQ